MTSSQHSNWSVTCKREGSSQGLEYGKPCARAELRSRGQGNEQGLHPDARKACSPHGTVTGLKLPLLFLMILLEKKVKLRLTKGLLLPTQLRSPRSAQRLWMSRGRWALFWGV